MQLSEAHGRNSLGIAGGFQGSRIKNASQLSQEVFACTFQDADDVLEAFRTTSIST